MILFSRTIIELSRLKEDIKHQSQDDILYADVGIW